MSPLPTGRRGQALAVGLALLALAMVWLAAVAPALDWYGARAEHLAEQQILADRMAAIVATAPALRQVLARADSAAPAPSTMLDGATDGIAGATLQQAMQDMAAKAGATVTSAEVLPAEAVGSYRRISLHVTATGGWPVIVALFSAVADATPRMLVNDVSLRQSLALGPADKHPLEASFTVIAFSAGAASAP